uniref:Deoxycytidylate deaminase n=1 Tax=Pelusios castaneus TaxID=367368 RepID=A0A8C8SEI0_9SAUR
MDGAQPSAHSQLNGFGNEMLCKKREDYLEWPEYFMAVAFLSAQRSKDPNSQVGACIVNSENKIVGIGYNGMPNGCSDDLLPWTRTAQNKLDTKYPYVCHAELNAIMNKNSADVKGCSMYVALFPCNECAKLIIQAGKLAELSNDVNCVVLIQAAASMERGRLASFIYNCIIIHENVNGYEAAWRKWCLSGLSVWGTEGLHSQPENANLGAGLKSTASPRHEIQGIKEVIFMSDKYHDSPEMTAARRMFDLAGTIYRKFKPKCNKIIIDFDSINSRPSQKLL